MKRLPYASFHGAGALKTMFRREGIYKFPKFPVFLCVGNFGKFDRDD